MGLHKQKSWARIAHARPQPPTAIRACVQYKVVLVYIIGSTSGAPLKRVEVTRSTWVFAAAKKVDHKNLPTTKLQAVSHTSALRPPPPSSSPGRRGSVSR